MRSTGSSSAIATVVLSLVSIMSGLSACAGGSKVGGMGEECYPDGSCDAALMCVNGICVPEDGNNDATENNGTNNGGTPRCGDGRKDSGEECDGLDFGTTDTDCTSYGYHGGVLRCADDCTLDFSTCESYGRCGDGRKDSGEECDGTDFGGASSDCSEYGYYGGTVLCTADCLMDMSLCEMAGRCGDGVKNGPEECDGNDFSIGSDLGSSDCADYGRGTGPVTCTSGCTYDFSGCTGPVTCPNGQIDSGEECDGSVFASGVETSCTAYGYYGGTVGCDSACHVTTQPCQSYGRCGDGVLQASYEECDGSNFGGSSTDCTAYGYYGGTVQCSSSCEMSYSQCEQYGRCGDGQIQTQYGEECDGNDVGGQECSDFGWLTGSLSCSGDCSTITTSGCDDLLLLPGGGGSENAVGVNVDSSGNIYVVGSTSTTIGTFNPGSASNGFVAKYTPSGSLVWAAGMNAATWSRFWNVVVDPNGNVYAAGEFEGDMTVGGNSITGAGGRDGVVVKFTPSGSVAWVRAFATNEWDYMSGIARGASGAIYVAGGTKGSLYDTNVSGDYNAVMVKLAALDGSVLKKIQINGGSTTDAAPVSAYGVAVNETAGKVYAVGRYTPVGGDTYGALFVLNSSDLSMSHISQQGSSGSWAYGVTVDGNGYVYMTITTPNGSNGGDDCRVIKLDSSGTAASWSTVYGSSSNDRCYGVTHDTVNNVYVAMSVGGAASGMTGYAGGILDAAVVKFRSTDGSLMAVRSWGGTGADFLYGVAMDGPHALVGAGYSGSASIDGKNIASGYDGFIIRVPPPLQ